MDDAFPSPTLIPIQQVTPLRHARACKLSVFQFGRQLAWLERVHPDDPEHGNRFGLLATWFSRLPVEKAVDRSAREFLAAADRLLFWVKALDSTPVGTVGLCHVDPAAGQAEIRSVIRGVPDILPGVMYAAVQTLAGWTFQTFDVKTIIVSVRADNAPAIRLFERCGFGAPARPSPNAPLSMHLSRAEWMAAHRPDKVPRPLLAA